MQIYLRQDSVNISLHNQHGHISHLQDFLRLFEKIILGGGSYYNVSVTVMFANALRIAAVFL